MSNYTWRAISAALESDATLLSLLGTGDSDSIIGEYEATENTAVPFLVICYDGSRRLDPFTQLQVWAFYVYHKKNAHTASLILKKVKDALHQQSITIDTDSGVACLEAEWFQDIPTDYDPFFKYDIEGSRYWIYTRSA
jgi:hypothetical protein